MASQIFKEKFPKEKFFDFLHNYCEKNDKYYILSKNAYKKAKMENGVKKFFDMVKPYYHVSKKFYLEREDNYKNLITVVRQICKNHVIAYTSNIKYSKSKYEIIYYIYV